MTEPHVLRNALVKHEQEPGPRMCSNVFLGAIDAGAQALHADLGAGDDDTLHEFLGSPDGDLMLKCWRLYGARILAMRAET